MLGNHYIGCLVIDGFDLLLCMVLFAGADAHLSGNAGKCSNMVRTWAVLLTVSKSPMSPNDKNTQRWQSIVSLFQDLT